MGHTVIFQANQVDATQLEGGYTSWQLLTQGPLTSPANIYTPPLSYSAVGINLIDEQKNNYLFRPKEGYTFTAGEVVKMVGPANKKTTLTTTGVQSGKKIVWETPDEDED